MAIPGFQNTVVCPYNKSHIVSKNRIQIHLTKCRKNYPLVEKAQCCYNNTHIVDKPEIKFHELYCADRVKGDRFLYDIGDTACAARDLLPINSVEMPDCNEDWDVEEAGVSVLDMIKEQANEKPLLRYLPGTTKSLRKNFRLQQRVHFQNLEPEKKPIKTEPRHEYINCSPYMKSTVPMLVKGPQTDQEFSKIVQAEIDPLLSKIAGIERGQGTRLFAVDVNSLSYNSKKLNVNHELELAMEDHNYTLPSSSKAVNDNSESMYNRVMSNEKMDIKSDDRNDKSSNNQIASYNFPTNDEGFCRLPIPSLGRGRKSNQ